METKYRAVVIISNNKLRKDCYARFTTVSLKSLPGLQQWG